MGGLHSGFQVFVFLNTPSAHSVRFQDLGAKLSSFSAFKFRVWGDSWRRSAAWGGAGAAVILKSSVPPRLHTPCGRNLTVLCLGPLARCSSAIPCETPCRKFLWAPSALLWDLIFFTMGVFCSLFKVVSIRNPGPLLQDHGIDFGHMLALTKGSILHLARLVTMALGLSRRIQLVKAAAAKGV